MPLLPYFLKLVTSVYHIFWVNFTQSKTKGCLKQYQNYIQDIPDFPIIQKNSAKKLPKAITVLKNRPAAQAAGADPSR